MSSSPLEEETKSITERSQRIADQFYSLDEGENLKELTDSILESSETKASLKELIRATGRRFFLFTYPSDGFLVKGTLSFLPDSEENPLLIFLRGGNKVFGLMHPASDFSCLKNYTVIATTYRDGVSEGTDEFGGADVNDVQHMMEYFPILQEKIGTAFKPKKTYILGRSRGGMEMFLALNKSVSLQAQVTKAVSLSGLLDLQECILSREDMKKMFSEEFGLVPGQEEEWMACRNPLTNVFNLRNDLPVLIFQGTEDLRASLIGGQRMVSILESRGNPVTYLEVPGGDHCLTNQPDLMDLIANWLEDVQVD